MSLRRYAIIDGTSVVNAVEYEQEPSVPLDGFPDNFIAVEHPRAGVGWSYIDGEFVEPNQTPVKPPFVSASPAQFRRELRSLGKMDAVDDLIATLDIDTQDDFEYATEFRSDSPKLLMLAAHPTIGMSEEDVYNALLRASGINIGA